MLNNVFNCIQYYTVYAIYFAYRYFCDFGLGGDIRDGLI